MKTIELRQVAITDLNIRYARSMGGNKIKHYVINMSSVLLGKLANQAPLDMLKDHLVMEEGEPVEIKILPTSYGGQFACEGTETEMAAGGTVLQVKDVENIILKDNPEIATALKQVHAKSQLYQYNENVEPIKNRYVNSVFSFINKYLISKINALLYKIQEPKFDFGMDTDENNELKEKTVGKIQSFLEKRALYQKAISKIKYIPHLPEQHYVRKVVPCSYLTVAFEEDDLQNAANSLLSDLKMLQQNGLIMGHLCMPRMIILADTIGSGKQQYALFCFLFVNTDKLMKLKNIESPLALPRKYLSLIGVQNETFEGGINYLNGIDPSSKYEIEEVLISIGGTTYDTSRQAVIDTYNAAKEYVNEEAKKASEALKKIKKVSSESTHIGDGNRTIAVRATFEGDQDVIDALNRKSKQSE